MTADVTTMTKEGWMNGWTQRKERGLIHSIQGTDSIFSITRVLKLDKRKAWRVPGYPDVPEGTILTEGLFNFTCNEIRLVSYRITRKKIVIENTSCCI